MKKLIGIAVSALVLAGMWSFAQADPNPETVSKLSDLRSAPAYFDTCIAGNATPDTIAFGFVADYFEVISLSSTQTDTLWVRAVGGAVNIGSGYRSGIRRTKSSALSAAAGAAGQGWPVMPITITATNRTGPVNPTRFDGYRAFTGVILDSKSSVRVCVRAGVLSPHQNQ